jgi:beta-N-acetylhexosaminidase
MRLFFRPVNTSLRSVAIVLFAFISCFSGCSRIRVIPYAEYLEREADSLVASMSLDQKASQVMMTGISGNESFAPWLREHFRDTVPGAVLLFKYNIADSPEAVHGYIDSCVTAFERMDSAMPPIFAIDHEGGDVYRMGSAATRLPSARIVATHLKTEAAQRLYDYSATQLALLGIGMNLAPLAETLNDDNREFLDSRAWSDSPDTTVSYATAAIRGFRSGGLVSVVKHFPGTGSGDPHSGDSVIHATKKEFYDRYVSTFDRILQENPEAVLVSHCLVPAIDPDTPFCVSEKGVRGILRRQLKYQGVVITDDIAMRALSKRGYAPGDAAVLAIKAGCDMVMTSDRDIKAIRRKIASAAREDPAFARVLDESVRRIALMKLRSGAAKTALRRYADSRYGGRAGTGIGSFRSDDYIKARIECERILGEMHGN